MFHFFSSFFSFAARVFAVSYTSSVSLRRPFPLCTSSSDVDRNICGGRSLACSRRCSVIAHGVRCASFSFAFFLVGCPRVAVGAALVWFVVCRALSVASVVAACASRLRCAGVWWCAGGPLVARFGFGGRWSLVPLRRRRCCRLAGSRLPVSLRSLRRCVAAAAVFACCSLPAGRRCWCACGAVSGCSRPLGGSSPAAWWRGRRRRQAQRRAATRARERPGQQARRGRRRRDNATSTTPGAQQQPGTANNGRGNYLSV